MVWSLSCFGKHCKPLVTVKRFIPNSLARFDHEHYERIQNKTTKNPPIEHNGATMHTATVRSVRGGVLSRWDVNNSKNRILTKTESLACVSIQLYYWFWTSSFGFCLRRNALAPFATTIDFARTMLCKYVNITCLPLLQVNICWCLWFPVFVICTVIIHCWLCHRCRCRHCHFCFGNRIWICYFTADKSTFIQPNQPSMTEYISVNLSKLLIQSNDITFCKAIHL